MDSETTTLPRDTWHTLFELMPDAATITRLADGRMLAANAGAAQIYGWSVEEMLGRTTLELGIFRDPEERTAMLALLERSGQFRDHPSPFWRRAREMRFGTFSARVIAFDGERCLLAIGRDVTEAKHQEEALREREARFRMLVEATLDIPWQLDLAGRVLYVGPGISRLGYDPLQLIGRPIFDILHPEDRPLVEQRLGARRKRDDVPAFFRVRVRGPQGDYHVLENNSSPVEDEAGEVTGAHGIARDISVHIEAQQRLYELAHRDALTGLLNRQGFCNELERALARTPRDEANDGGVGFLFVDLDDFKQVNDTAGHAVGDACLRSVATALQQVLRATDRAGRIGGDEFAVLLTPVDREGAMGVARRLLDLFRDMARDAARCPVPLTASVGVYLAQPGDSPNDLMDRADAAMYRAKAAGKNRVDLHEVRANP